MRLENMFAAAAVPPLVMRRLTFDMRRSLAQRSITRCNPSLSQKA